MAERRLAAMDADPNGSGPAPSTGAGRERRHIANAGAAALNARCRCAVLAAASLLAASAAHAGVYVGGEAGAALFPAMKLRSGDTDRASRCDEFINPRYAELEGCTNPDRGTGAVDDWKSDFDRGAGGLASAALGYRFAEGYRLELEAIHHTANRDESAAILSPEGTPFTQTFGAELPRADETIGRFAATGIFANLIIDFPNASRFTPFFGLGAGVVRARMDYAAWWERSDAPDLMETARGLPNEAEVRRNLAGTVSRTSDHLRDRLRGYQLLFGARYRLSGSLGLELRGRWTSLSAFGDGGQYKALRSHVSNLRRDGSEPVRYRVKTEDTQRFGIGLRLNYQVGRRR